MCFGTEKWIRFDSVHESGSYGILENLSRHAQHILVVPQYVLVPVALPQLLVVHFFEVEARKLFCTTNERETVGIISQPFDKQVQMIWHEAVRNYRHVFIRRRSQNLLQNCVHVPCDREVSGARMRAEGKEISVETAVIEGLEMFGVSGKHASGIARSDPCRSA